MKSNSVMHSVIEYKTIFEDEALNLDEYLNGISRDQLIKCAIFFLSFSNKNSEFEHYSNLLQMFFCEDNAQFKENVISKIQAHERKGFTNISIINVRSSLVLFEYAFENLNEDHTQSYSEAEINIFKAYLLINQDLLEKEENIEKTLPNNDIKFPALSLTQSFPYSGLQNYNLTELVATQMIKSILLFEFLDACESTRYLLEQYLQQYQSENWQEHLQKLFSLAIKPYLGKRDHYVDIVVEKDHNFEKITEFIENLVIQDDTSIADVDYRKIRCNPYFKIDEGHYRLIFIVFAIELLHKGIYFKLNEINETLDADKKINGFRSLYCHQFSENYLLYKCLNSIYKNKYIKYTGEKILEQGIDAEPDYYLRNGSKIFLFESKDILINANVKSTFDYNAYETEFKKKLYFEEKKKKVKKKAILQLMNNIERILNGTFNIDSNHKSTSTIYPILVLHDHQLNISGLNNIVNYWFEIELEKLSQKGLNTSKVKPITIINIDTLLYIHDPLQNNQIKLEKIIDAYHKHCNVNKKQNFRDQNHLSNTMLDKISPFSNFALNYIAEKGIKLAPKMIKEQGIKLF